jgi:hypothetical protein
MIILAECRSLMDYTSTIAIRHVGVHYNSEGLVLELWNERNKINARNKKCTASSNRTFSVKYSNNGTYLHPFMSAPWNCPIFLNFAFLGSLYRVRRRASCKMKF